MYGSAVVAFIISLMPVNQRVLGVVEAAWFDAAIFPNRIVDEFFR